MALTYPYSLDVFWNDLPVESATPLLTSQQELSGQGSGRIIPIELASPLWRAEVALGALTRQEEGRFLSLIDALDGGQKTFLFTPKARPFPFEDPNGVVLGASTPVIASVGANNKSIAISGLPPGYQLRAGDFLSFVISGRNHLHRLVEDGAANGVGLTQEIELRPFLRPGVVNGASVTLSKPVTEMFIEPGSVATGTRRGATLVGVGFNIIQKL